LDAGYIAGIAAQLKAANNLTLNGVGGIDLEAGGNTAQFDSSHVSTNSGFFGSSTTHNTVNDNNSTINASNLTAGGTLDLASSAGDINLQAINLQGSTINLSALQGVINLLAGYNTDQSSITSTTKISGLGQALSWTGPLETMIAGSNGTGQGMNVSQTGQVTTLTAGTGGITLQAQGNITSQGTDLTSGGNITISSSQGQVILGAVNNLLQQASSSSSSNPWLVSSSMSSTTSQTSQLSQMQYAGQLVVNAAQGIQIDVPISQGGSTQNIQTLVTQLASQPGMSWLANMQTNGQIDYNQIQQIYQHQSSSSTSLGVASDLVIAIAVTIATAGAGGPAAGAALAASDAATAAGASASVAAAAGAAASAAVVSTAIAVTDATINSGLNGQGLSGIVDRLNNKATVDSILASALTAGIAQGVISELSIQGLIIDPSKLNSGNLLTINGTGSLFASNLIHGVTGAIVNQVIYGGNLGQNLTQAGLTAAGNTVGAIGFDAGANYVLGSDGTSPSLGQEGGITLATVHGLTGALTGYIIGGTGQSALAGGASGFVTELATPYTAQLANGNNNVLTAINQAIGGLAAGAVTGNDNLVGLGENVAGLETQYNQALHGLHPLQSNGNYQTGSGSESSVDGLCTTSGSYSVCQLLNGQTLNGYAIYDNGVLIGTQGAEVNALGWTPDEIANAVTKLQSMTLPTNTATLPTSSSDSLAGSTTISASGNNGSPSTTSSPLAMAVGTLGLSQDDTQKIINNLNLMASQQQLDFLNGIQSGDITANNAVFNSLMAAAQNITGQYMTPSEQTHALLGTLMVVPGLDVAAAIANAGYTVDRASTGGTTTDPYGNGEAVGALLLFAPQIISGVSGLVNAGTDSTAINLNSGQGILSKNAADVPVGDEDIHGVYNNQLPLKTISLPSGYIANVDGTITGPSGGLLTIAGTTSDGTPVFQRVAGGSYFTVDSTTGNQVAELRSDTTNGITWNTLPSTSQISQNWASGRAFQNALNEATGLPENTTPKTVILPDGTTVTTIADNFGKPAGIVEAKDVVNLSMNNQLQAQLQIAEQDNIPFNLVVSPNNQVISQPLWNAIEEVGGKVYQYNPTTQTMTQITERPH
jgi:hypothetical protein